MPPEPILCPPCGQPLDDGPTNKDHVFGQAFGGRATVRVHTACNSIAGHTIEAHLSAPDGPLTFQRADQGLAKRPIVGKLPDGRQVEVDFKAETVAFSEVTVETTTTDGRIEIEISGSPSKVEGVLKDLRRKYGNQIPTLSEYPQDKIDREVIERPEVTTRLTIRPEAVIAAGINIALGAGVLAAGESFASSELASALRERRDVQTEGVVDVAKVEALDVLDEQYEAVSAAMAASGLPERELPKLKVDGSANEVVFIPYDKRTIVFVRLLGLQLFGQGLVLDAPMPTVGAYGPPVAPVLVRETADELLVVDFTERLIP